MKTIYLTVILITAFTVLSFSQTRDIVSELTRANEKGARVNVENISSVKTETGRLDNAIKAYRVRIFFDNSQDARAGSTAAKTQFESMYPNTPTFVDYTAPYFKVTVGNFLTREEAIILLGKISGVFTNAFVVTENIPLKEFTSCNVLNEVVITDPLPTEVETQTVEE